MRAITCVSILLIFVLHSILAIFIWTVFFLAFLHIRKNQKRVRNASGTSITASNLDHSPTTPLNNRLYNHNLFYADSSPSADFSQQTSWIKAIKIIYCMIWTFDITDQVFRSGSSGKVCKSVAIVGVNVGVSGCAADKIVLVFFMGDLAGHIDFVVFCCAKSKDSPSKKIWYSWISANLCVIFSAAQKLMFSMVLGF